MSRVEEIERAIAELSPEEFRQVAQRVHDIETERWDKQLDRDAAAGKLDLLRQEAQADRKNDALKDWPRRRLSLKPANDVGGSSMASPLTSSASPKRTTI